MEKSEAKKTFSHTSLQDQASLAIYLQALADGFRKGRIKLESSGDILELHPTEGLELNLVASRIEQHYRLSLEVQWDLPGNEDSSGELTIKS